MDDSLLFNYLNSLPEWNDDVRARALYSRFAEKNVNKTAYEARLSIWKRILTTAAINGYLSSNENDARFCINSKDLNLKFKRKGVIPLGLQTVIDEMVESCELVSIHQFNQGHDNTSTIFGWFYGQIMLNTFNWAWLQLFGSNTKDYGDEEGQQLYVIVQAVKDAAVSLSEAVYNSSITSIDLIFSIEDLRRQFGKNYTLSDLMLICQQLAIDKKVILDMNSSLETSIIKFKPPRSELKPISEIDKGILAIKTTMMHLNKQVSQLNLRSTELLEQTKTFLRNKEKIRAKFTLRQQKMVDTILGKRLQSLQTVEEILQKLQSAETDAELLSVYEIGSKTLGDFISEKGLTVEKVESTMNELDDALADQVEVENAITFGNQQVASTYSTTRSDEDLEAELNALIQQTQSTVGEERKKTPLSPEDEIDLIRELDGLRVSDANKYPIDGNNESEKDEEALVLC